MVSNKINIFAPVFSSLKITIVKLSSILISDEFCQNNICQRIEVKKKSSEMKAGNTNNATFLMVWTKLDIFDFRNFFNGKISSMTILPSKKFGKNVDDISVFITGV